MSDICGSCSCADRSQCAKKGNSYGVEIVETETSCDETPVMDVAAAENHGKCKCGPCCHCVVCPCGHH